MVSGSSRGLGVIAFLVVMVASAAGGFVAGRLTAPGGRLSSPRERTATEAAAPTASEPHPAPAAPAQPASERTPAATPAVTPAPSPAKVAAPAPASQAVSGPRRIVVTLEGPLEESITSAVPAEDRPIASELTQVVNRLLVWSLQVARDGRKGDRLELLYTLAQAGGGAEPGSQEPVVEALRYTSQKLNSTIAAYHYKVPGARWARYYRPDGSELEERLVDAPTTEYDQITSLLRDGRHHKGVDFRVPVGTPVHATFDGVVERRNWNFGGNGNCLDIRDTENGRHAIFLHLEVLPKDMVPGRKVKKGEEIAVSGNSGHSFAPHVHYQLESPDHEVLDPFEVQQVRRLSLDASAKPGFDAERARLDLVLSGGTADPSPGPASPK